MLYRYAYLTLFALVLGGASAPAALAQRADESLRFDFTADADADSFPDRWRRGVGARKKGGSRKRNPP